MQQGDPSSSSSSRLMASQRALGRSYLTTNRPRLPNKIEHLLTSTFLGHRTASTNISSLPDNILCMIFHTVVFSPTRRSLGYKTPLTYERCSSPFPILHVCLKWRRLMIGMGEVWRSIFIQSPSEKHIQRTALWMQYAGKNPLRITVITSPTPSEEEQEYLHAILDILATKLEFWNAVVFEFNGRLPPSFTDHMKNLRKSPQPSLKNFFLHLPPNPREVLQVLSIWESVNAMPSLRAFRWDCAHTPGLQLSPRLETLDLSSPIALDDLLARLSPCKNLSSLRVRKITAPSDGFNPDALARVKFPHMRDLVLEAVDTDLAPLLEHLSTPNLVVLGLKNIQHGLFAPVSRLCKHTAGSLYAVSLAFAQPPAEDDVQDWLWMPQFQELSMLSMLGVRLTDTILDTLTLPAHTTAMAPCLPRLEGLHLGTVRTDVDSAAVLRMLGSRFWPPPPACAMHEMDGVNVDQERTQLKKAAILVSEAAHTPQLKRYQTMFEQSVASTPGWGDRELEFEVV
ncbi:hypothetical protein D9619_005077 [Psilocybe cf. subviscida]|uniref:F-box domain-containing protein n=1 Tax=Psilocybe cf. subviscida TaxID=2480587 RepID=A0A8H5F8V4_9AGAR|nr:hypothetical protein D9619_005077 [Psilocybe cf. subviscida]